MIILNCRISKRRCLERIRPSCTPKDTVISNLSAYVQPGLGNVAGWYVVVLSAYHLFTGAISYFTPGFALRCYRGAYGCDPIERRHLLIILRPWGALAFFA